MAQGVTSWNDITGNEARPTSCADRRQVRDWRQFGWNKPYDKPAQHTSLSEEYENGGNEKCTEIQDVDKMMIGERETGSLWSGSSSFNARRWNNANFQKHIWVSQSIETPLVFYLHVI